MDEQRISRLLASLPSEEASPHFTAAVLRRLDQSAPTRRPLRRLVLAASAAVLLVAGAFGVHEWSGKQAREHQRQETLVRLRALEAEKQTLEAEISKLRRMARDSRPVVYLGSTQELDVVVDLSRLARRRSRTPDGWVQPASRSGMPSRRYVTLPQESQPKGEHRR